MTLTPEQYAAKVLDLVREDMRTGAVPESVSSFAELHDYVDANGYLSDAGVPFGTDAGSGEDGSGMVNAVCGIVSRVLTVMADTHPVDVPASPVAWERAVAGVCSHGGHGWDGETCSDAGE